MSIRARQLLPSLGFVVFASLVMAWLGLRGDAGSDFKVEAWPSIQALLAGDLTSALERAPAYGGTLALRAPFAAATGAFDDSGSAAYRAMAIPCLIAAAVLGLYIARRMRASEQSARSCAVLLAVVVANPLTYQALRIGHPEELLGGVLCVAAVLTADRGRPGLAGVLLGLAVANKPWALLAAGPVLIALPAARAGCMIVAAAVASAVLAPFLAAGTFAETSVAVATHKSTLFQPWQIWWFFGDRVPVGSRLHGGEVGYHRVAPDWIAGVARPLILALAVPLTAAAWKLRANAQAGRLGPALLLLGLLLLLRCLLDTWNTVYYPLPCLLAIASWEVLVLRRAPMLAVTATVLCWISFVSLDSGADGDLRAAFFLLWAVPLVGYLATRLYTTGTERGAARTRIAPRAVPATGR